MGCAQSDGVKVNGTPGGDASSGGSGGSGGSSGSAGSGGSAAGAAGMGGDGGMAGAGGSAGAGASGGSGGMDAGGDAIITGNNEACPGADITFAGTPPGKLTASISDGTPPKDDVFGSCGGGGAARDAVYHFRAPVNGVVNIDYTPTAFNAVLYVRSTCNTSSTEIACVDAGASGGVEHITFFATAGLDYFIVADAASASDAGLFQLDVELLPETAENSCPGKPVAFSGAGAMNRTASVMGDTGLHYTNFTASCAASSDDANDAVYEFTPDVNGILTLELVPGFNGVLSARSSCSSQASEIDCKNAAGTATESMTFKATAGSKVYAVVDGANQSSQGTFTLNATLTPSTASEECPGEVITLSGSGTNPRTGSVASSTANHWPDYPDCAGNGNASPDLVYKITSPVNGTLTATLSPTGFDGVLGLKTSCGSGPALKCASNVGSGGNEVITEPVNSGTDYFLFVDGIGANQVGNFTLGVSIVPQKDNERCDGEFLSYSGSPITLSGDLSTAFADYGCPVCSTALLGKDVVYQLQVPANKNMLNVTLTPIGWDAALYLRSTVCDNTSSPTMSANNAGYNGNEYLIGPIGPGTYYLFIDSDDGSSGPYNLSVNYQ